MSVYVDKLLNYGWKLGASCHMTADTLDELHIMADKIGMKRSWFQKDSGSGVPHYDLVASKRKLAVQNGSLEVPESWKETAEHIKRMQEIFKSPTLPPQSGEDKKEINY